MPSEIPHNSNGSPLFSRMGQKVIRSSQKTGGWYRNPVSCFNPYPCSYLSVCQNRDLETNTPVGFVRDENVHAELSLASEEG